MNTQPIERIVHNQNTLDLINIWRTIQGEGPFAGERATFVRLAGCNLQCPFCDTNYTHARLACSVANITEMVAVNPDSLVVITGGEPFRQNLKDLVWNLHDCGKKVQIETNGIIFREDFPFDIATIVCSPKTAKIHPKLRPYVDAFKYILAHGCIDPDDGLPSASLGYEFKVARPTAKAEVYVQPLDEQNPELNKLHTAAALHSVCEYGYKLCLQIHKIVGAE